MAIGEFDKPLEIGPRQEMSPTLQALLTALNLFFAQTLLAQPHGYAIRRCRVLQRYCKPAAAHRRYHLCDEYIGTYDKSFEQL